MSYLVDIKAREEVVTCPYNSTHRILGKKLTTHLVKCGKHYRNNSDRYDTCPFNATHRIPELQMAYHMTECPDRVTVEREVLINKKRDPGVKAKKNSIHAGTSGKEDWDEELEGDMQPSYDPALRMNVHEVRNSTTLCYMKPADKRKYYKHLVESFKEEKINQITSEEATIAPQIPKLKDVRMPKTLSMAQRFKETPNEYLTLVDGKSGNSTQSAFENLREVAKGRARTVVDIGMTSKPESGSYFPRGRPYVLDHTSSLSSDASQLGAKPRAADYSKIYEKDDIIEKATRDQTEVFRPINKTHSYRENYHSDSSSGGSLSSARAMSTASLIKVTKDKLQLQLRQISVLKQLKNIGRVLTKEDEDLIAQKSAIKTRLELLLTS